MESKSQNPGLVRDSLASLGDRGKGNTAHADPDNRFLGKNCLLLGHKPSGV